MTISNGPPPMKESEWIENLKKMDRPAWDTLLSSYTDSLLSYVTWLAGTKYQSVDQAMCEDVIQQTWTTVIETIGGFEYRGDGRLYPWICTIAFNHLRNTWRQTQSGAGQSFQGFEDDFSLDSFLHEEGLYDDSLESKTLRRERMMALDAALRQLSARDREIVTRRLMWGEKPQQLAEAYGLEPQTVSAIIGKAKKKIYLQLITHDLFRPSRSYSIKGDDQ